MKQKITPILCKSALHKVQGGFPYTWDLNIYRGCEHACRYCYAMYSHKYLDESHGATDFFNEIFVKTNIVEQLERELCKPSWKREVINIGGVTDSYQKIEATQRIMPEILKLLIRYKTPAVISTKSPLILRDYELIDTLSRITYVNVALTITTLDEKLQQVLEPGASSPQERFEVLKAFHGTNASLGLHVMPIIPHITDDYDGLNALFAKAQEIGVHYVLPGILNLRGETRKKFFRFIESDYPELYSDFDTLYRSTALLREYQRELNKTINGLLCSYELSRDYTRPMKAKIRKQGLFF